MGYSETFCGAHKHLTEMEIIMSKKQTNQSPNYENCSDSTQNCGSNNSSTNLLQSQATRALTNLLQLFQQIFQQGFRRSSNTSTIVCTRVGICSTQHQLCSDRILADHVFIIGMREVFYNEKQQSGFMQTNMKPICCFFFCLSVCSEFTDWIA